MGRIAGSESMEQLASRFTQQASAVEQLRSDLQNQVSSIVQVEWEGEKARTFSELWNSQFSPSLQQLQQALTEAGEEVRKAWQNLQTWDHG